MAALLTVLLWVGVDSASRVLIKRLGRELTVLAITASGIIPMLILFFMTGRSPAIPQMVSPFLLIAASIIGGVALFLGYIYVYKSVSDEGVANSFLLEELQAPLLIIFGIFVLSEHLRAYEMASMLIVFSGLAIVVLSERFRINRRLLPSVFGNVLWVIYWFAVIIAVLYYHNFILPLLLVRVVSALFALAFFILSKPSRSPKKEGLQFAIIALVLIIGIMDGTGNILFSFISFSNKVAIGSIMLTMGPILVWLIGFFLFKERITRVQKVGFVVATIGYVILAIL
ncbi:MAG: EamA family transporter [Candidatus Micrarchaeia archaeon]